VKEKLIPNIPKNSMVFSDNAPYHCVRVGKPRSKCAVNAETVSRFRRQEVASGAGLMKHQLYKLSGLKMPGEKTYMIHRILNTCEHMALELPELRCHSH
jgi:hypothetical protein